MNCPLCSHDSRVIDGRGTTRRRECTHCRHRWTTVEVVKTQADKWERLEKIITFKDEAA